MPALGRPQVQTAVLTTGVHELQVEHGRGESHLSRVNLHMQLLKSNLGIRIEIEIHVKGRRLRQRLETIQ